MSGDFPAGLRVIVHAPEVVAVRHRRERAVERQDLQAVPWQIELANDLGPQQRHHIGADRVLEAGKISSVTAAPPSTCRRSTTSTLRPARARYAALTSPLWPPPITITS